MVAASSAPGRQLVHVACACGVLYRAGGEEQTAFEESVVQTVQQAGGNGQRSAHAQAHHHVTNLADGGEGQHPLQVSLHHGVHHAYGHGYRTNPNQRSAQATGHAPKLCMRAAR